MINDDIKTLAENARMLLWASQNLIQNHNGALKKPCEEYGQNCTCGQFLSAAHKDLAKAYNEFIKGNINDAAH